MKLGRLLVIFQPLSEIHLTKDVGGIPTALYKYWGIDYHFIGGKYTPKGDKYTCAALCNVPSKLIQKIGFLYTVVRTIKPGDIANIYHLSPISAMTIMVLRILYGDRIKIYLKLDMNTKEQSLRIARIIAGTANACSLREIMLKLVGRWICRQVDFISSESSTVFSITSTWPSKVMLKIPNGFFQEAYPLACELSESGRVNRFISVARHGSEPKRSEELLKAFSIALLPPDWTLSLVGEYTEQFEQLLEETIKEKPQLKDKVILHGPIHDRRKLMTLLSSSKIFTTVSSYEGFSLALLEAAACGCYCVSTKAGGATDVVGENGILIENNADPVSIAAALEVAVLSSMNFNHVQFANQTAVRFRWKTVLEPLIDAIQGKNTDFKIQDTPLL